MTPDRKRPSAGFWITAALVAVLVAYPLSFGPVCWIASRTRSGAAMLPTVYRPITMAMTIDEPGAPSGVDGIFYSRPRGVINSYAQLCAVDAWSWRRVGEYRIDNYGRLELMSESWEWSNPSVP